MVLTAGALDSKMAQHEALLGLWKECRGVFGELPLLLSKLIAHVLVQIDDGRSAEQVSPPHGAAPFLPVH
jgi:hypothetical protein